MISDNLKSRITQLKLQEVLDKIQDLKLHKSLMTQDKYRKEYIKLYNLRKYYMKQIGDKWFICEICKELTPIECEGKEPNVCADCYGEIQW